MATLKVKECKIILVGRIDIGKTAIIEQFIFQQFPMIYGPTEEAVCSKQCIVDEEMVFVDILEIATQENAGAYSIWPQYINHAEGFLLAYSITSRASFNELDEIYQHIRQTRRQASFPMILIGNKCDLESDRQVTLAEGENLARQLECPFLEISAKDNISIEGAFYDLIRKINRSNKGQRSKPTVLTADSHNDKHHSDKCCAGCVAL